MPLRRDQPVPVVPVVERRGARRLPGNQRDLLLTIPFIVVRILIYSVPMEPIVRVRRVRRTVGRRSYLVLGNFLRLAHFCPLTK